MESMNKFKVLTVIIVCMFLFVIAAIYSNTKDVATSNKSSLVGNFTSFDKAFIITMST